MNKILSLAGLIGTASFCFGQGYVEFITVSSTVKTNGATASTSAGAYNGAPSNGGVSWYYELLVAPTSQITIDATLAGWTPIFLGTNTINPGRLSGANSPDGQAVQVPNYGTGASANFAVVGWSANLGSDWSAIFAGRPSSLVSGVGNFGIASWANISAPLNVATPVPDSVPPGGWYGISPVAANISLAPAGGPYSDVFGGAGINSLFLNYYSSCNGATPLVLEQPQSVTAFIGGTASFSVVPSRYSSCVAYQWQFNGVNIPRASSDPYTITNVQLTDAGTYSVILTNWVGSITSAPAILQALPPNAPSTEVNGRLGVGSAFTIGSAQLSFSGGFPSGLIFYTLDGTAPTTSSPLYTEPVTLTSSATVQAMSLSADFSETAYAPAVSVQIVPVYNLQVTVVGSGSINSNPGGNPYPSNSVVVLTATAALGWTFDHWTGDATGAANPLSLTMNGPRTVEAVFIQTGYPITVTTPGGGSVTVNGQSIPPLTFYQIGSVVTVAAAASNDWSFLGWQGDASGTNNPLSVTISQTNNIQAIFGTVVGTNTAGGGAIVFSQPNPVPFGTTLRASAVPDPGGYFLTWSGAASGTNAPTTIAVTSPNPTVGALFTSLPGGKCSLAVVVIGNGSVTISPQQNYYNAGDTVTLSASTTNAGTSFVGWSEDGLGTANPLTLVLNTNKVVVANFGSLPSVTITPRSLAVLAGSNAVLNANAVGLPPLSYQWFHGAAGVVGATNDTFGITNAQPLDAGSYSVVVSNPYGSITSEIATVTVVFPPSITQEPASATVPAGTALTLAVLASGTPPLDYQWLNSAGAITGASNASFTMNPIQTNNADAYFVVVTNLYGAITSSPATVTVYVPVSITAQPASRVVSAHTMVSFSVLASAYPAPAYQWRFWGTNLPGATLSSLPIANAGLTDLGDYAVFVNNGYSSILSDSATLSMSPSITSPFRGATAIWGKSASLSVSAIGSGLLDFQWYKDGVLLGSGTNQTLNLPTVQLGDGGLYSVVVSSDFGSVTNSAQLVVNPAGMDLGLFAGITISGVAGYSYQIQYTTDLRVTNSWITLTNRTLEQPVELWVDITTNAAATRQRFYRILPGQ